MADDDSSMSARDRRRERAKSTAPSAGGLALRRYRGHLVILLITAAVITTMVVSSRAGSDCPGHWHARTEFYVNGEHYTLAHPKFTLEGSSNNGGSMAISIHMHRGSEGEWHFEPISKECTDFSEAIRFADIEVSEGRIEFKGAHDDLGQAGVFADNGTSTLRVFTVQDSEESTWKEVSAKSVMERQLNRGERVLFVYGDDTDAELAQYQSTVKAIPVSGSTEPTHTNTIAMVTVGIIGLLAVAGWNALSKKA